MKEEQSADIPTTTRRNSHWISEAGFKYNIATLITEETRDMIWTYSAPSL